MSRITKVTSMHGSENVLEAVPRKIAMMLVILLFGAVALVSCGTDKPEASQAQGPSVSESSGSTEKMVKFLRSTVSYDFEPVASPRILLDDVDVAMMGTVSSVDAVLIEDDAENTGGILVSLDSVEIWRSLSDVGNGHVEFLLRRPTNVDVGMYQDGLEQGTVVVLFGYRSSLPIVDRDSTRPDFYEPDPQGFMVETAEGELLNVWHEEGSGAWEGLTSLDALVSSLEVRVGGH